MCGIFALINNKNTFSQDFIYENFIKGKSRGPESSKLQELNKKITLGFHRLAINGLDEISDQPITINNIT